MPRCARRDSNRPHLANSSNERGGLMGLCVPAVVLHTDTAKTPAPEMCAECCCPVSWLANAECGNEDCPHKGAAE